MIPIPVVRLVDEKGSPCAPHLARYRLFGSCYRLDLKTCRNEICRDGVWRPVNGDETTLTDEPTDEPTDDLVS